MSNTSNLTYKELAIPYFKEVFDCIDEVLTRMGIPYYLVGVNALALELLKKGIKPSRGTKDIDFALMIASFNQFEEVIDQLERKGFHKVKAPWTLYHASYKTAIDLLPFGEVEQKDTVQFHERYSDLHVLGFKEVLEDATTVMIEDKLVRVPPLRGMIIPKLVAWSDRPEDRQNDLYDILLVIRKYYDLEAEWHDIMDNHYDLIPEDAPFDPLMISARVLGRNAASILQKSPRLYERITQLLYQNTVEIGKSAIGMAWAKANQWELMYATKLLIEFQAGIQERKK